MKSLKEIAETIPMEEMFANITDDVRDNNLKYFSKMVEKNIELIKSFDKMSNPDCDDTEEVVGLNALPTPLLAMISDAYYLGYANKVLEDKEEKTI